MTDHPHKAASIPVSEWDYCTINELVEALQSRTISASELLVHTIARRADVCMRQALPRPCGHNLRVSAKPRRPSQLTITGTKFKSFAPQCSSDRRWGNATEVARDPCK